MAVLAQQRKTLFVNSDAQTDKYLIQFSIWKRGAKNLNSIYDSLEKYVRTKNKKIFCKNGACLKKKFSFFNEKLRRKLFVKKNSQ